MRVLTYTSLFPNSHDPEHGVFVYQRMVHLAQRPLNTVQVVAPIPWAPPRISPARYRRTRSIPRKERVGGLSVLHPRYLLLPGLSMPMHGWFMFAGSRHLLRNLHAEQRFDVIDAHYVYPDGFAAMLAGKMLGLPVVVSARGTDVNLFPQFKLIRPMIRWTLRNAIGGIGVCTPLRDAMVDLGLSINRATVIGNGVDLQRFTPLPREHARKHLAIQPDARVLVGVGALIPRKGFHLLIRAFAALTREVPKATLYIVGEGIQRRELETLVRELRLSDKVFLPGKCPNEELRAWYSAADVSCLTSSREGWPNVLLESLACGTPVVATAVWGVPEVISSPMLGTLVQPSVPAIADGLKQALAACWDRDALVAHARSRTWRVVAAELEAFLEERLL